jgi:hypothetical protein
MMPMPYDAHIPDEDLIQAIDGELSDRRASEINNHITHCWRCRARQGELERAIGDFVGLHRTMLDSRIPPAEGPAARLKAQMSEFANVGSKWNWTRHRIPLACSAAVITITVVALFWVSGQRASAGYLPDSRLTPGATRLISKEEVCAVPVSDDDRPISVELASRVFREYRIQPRPKAYEVDYLITPALGGASDIRNLWPQPYESGVWTARVKDALEDYLRNLVCEGRVDLATAQHEIATDWISAYRKYFRTDRPVPAHALFVKDRPWE